MYKKLLTACMGLCLTHGLFAGSIVNDYAQSKSYAQGLQGLSLQALQEFNPKSTFKNYNANPDEAHHYESVETEHIDLTAKAQAALNKDVGGQTVIAHFGEHQFEINKKSAVIQASKLIEEESHAITHGTSSDNISCDEQNLQCDIKAHDEVCHTSRILPDVSCIKTLQVQVDKERLTQRADFQVWVEKKWTGVITVNLMTGLISSPLGGHLSRPITLNHPCATMSAQVHSVLNNGAPASWVHISGLPTCQNNGVISLVISDKFSRAYPLNITLTVDATTHPFISHEYWENSCAHDDKEGLCTQSQEQCTDSNAQRVINGLNISRSCWRYDSLYHCRSAQTDECKVPKEKGCLQKSSHCARMENNACAVYEQVYQCQDKVCTKPPACLKNLFCANGECADPKPTQNMNFGDTMAPLAVLGGAGQEFSKTQATLFSGKPVQCKVWFADLIDCCSNKGWADTLHLDLCREEDKALGQAKLNHLTHYVGKYCSKKVLGACTEHKRTYCVYDSKMARIIQEEGRLMQLNPNALGDAEHASCGGLSVAELQQLDMGRINFIDPVYPFPSGPKTKEAGIVGDVQGPKAVASVDEMRRRIEKRAGV